MEVCPVCHGTKAGIKQAAQAEKKLLKEHVEAYCDKHNLEQFIAGMNYAAEIRRQWHITEQDGVTALKQTIREVALNLKLLPK